MRDIDERGLRAVMERAIDIAGDGTAGFHLSLDMDRRSRRCARRRHAGARRHDVSRGASGDGDHLRCDRMISMEVVEVNPVIDEANRTAMLAWN